MYTDGRGIQPTEKPAKSEPKNAGVEEIGEIHDNPVDNSGSVAPSTSIAATAVDAASAIAADSAATSGAATATTAPVNASSSSPAHSKAGNFSGQLLFSPKRLNCFLFVGKIANFKLASQ